jgi:hypothetical protein
VNLKSFIFSSIIICSVTTVAQNTNQKVKINYSDANSRDPLVHMIETAISFGNKEFYSSAAGKCSVNDAAIVCTSEKIKAIYEFNCKVNSSEKNQAKGGFIFPGTNGAYIKFGIWCL